jgi:hypothetical protein
MSRIRVNGLTLLQSYEMGIRNGYSVALPNGKGLKEAFAGAIFNQVIQNSMISTKVTCAMRWSNSFGAYSFTYRQYVDSGWGPYPPAGADVKNLRPFDRGWSKENQCRQCSRFGDNFYTLGEGAFSSCLKAGPGKMANAEHTGTNDSEESRYKYTTLPKNGDRDVSIYVTWEDDKEGTNSHTSASVRVKFHDMKNNPIQFEAKQEDCNFDLTPVDSARTQEIKMSDNCVLENTVILSMSWPKACGPQSSGACKVVAVIDRSSDAKKNPDLYPDPVGKPIDRGNTLRPAVPSVESTTAYINTGDTRKFGIVELASGGTDHVYEVSTAVKHRYRVHAGATLSNLRAVKGRTLVYRLITARWTPTSLGCSTHISQTDQVSAYNTFTYYYPIGANFGLENLQDSSLAFSYENMQIEQKNAMLYFKISSPSIKKQAVLKMPFRIRLRPGHIVNAALCIDRKKTRNEICQANSDSKANVAEYMYEALAEQGSAYKDEVAWADPEQYFGNFPNYDKSDIAAGWDNPTLVKQLQERLTDQRVVRAAALCIPCAAGYDGFTDGSNNGRRFLRAVLGPKGNALSTGGVRVTPSDYSRVCRKCTAGTFNSRAGGKCRYCKAGLFSLSHRLGGRVPAFMAQQAPRRCWECLPGFRCKRMDILASIDVCNVTTHGSMCPCVPGTYQDERGQQECKPCPIGTTTAQSGATSISACRGGAVPAGFRFHGPFTDRLVPIASVYPLDVTFGKPLNLMPVECEKGTYSAVARFFTNTSVRCIPCAPGGYTHSTGYVQCLRCNPGKYNPFERATACSECRAGKNNPNFIVGIGRTSCTECKVNEYAETRYDHVCTSCPHCQVRKKGEPKCTFEFGNDDDVTHETRWRRCNFSMTGNDAALQAYWTSGRVKYNNTPTAFLRPQELIPSGYNSVHAVYLFVMFLMWWMTGLLLALNDRIYTQVQEDKHEQNYWNFDSVRDDEYIDPPDYEDPDPPDYTKKRRNIRYRRVFVV